METAGGGLKPSAMRGNETRYGYVLALELLAVGVMNLTVTHGKGAPSHPQTVWAVLGLIGAVALVAVLRTQNRMIVGFGAIIAAFLTTIPKTPNSLTVVHTITIVIALVYTLLLTQRQRREATAQLKQNRGAAPKREPRRKRKEPEEPRGPRPSRRYTPPKDKRPTGKSSTGRAGRR